ncbi:MAG: SDR family oxidoreductase [Desulfuromonadales bacterium]|nr:SDR family oxidoreductase [Desulfuromonadales bacterium]NIR33692.1 SDR family oxidoreductase [Desulfuromonadales bacterium]NIS44014.1 SDR family oxidoreductase [Desulfuromonadales bacterium]
MEKVLIIGFGNIGRRVARLCLDQGASVSALVRSQEAAAAARDMGIEPVEGNLDFSETLTGLPTDGATVFFFAPPPGGGFSDPRMRNFCAAVPEGQEPEKIVYISTSGVYGDCGGDWVTELTPPNPSTSRARRRFDAETALREWGAERGVASVVLRVTGIYGPEWTPVTRLQAGHPVLRLEEAPYTNRIHADDLARVCVAAAHRGEAGDVFNVSDGQPSTMTEYFLALADALEMPRPQQVSMDEAREVMSPTMLSYLTESRRLDNRKMREKLGVDLRYPDLESAMPDLVAGVKDILERPETRRGRH